MYQLIILISIVLFGAGLMQDTNHKKPDNPSLEESQPKELGKVKWLRDLKVATSQSAKESKPIFLLFQEVPGCATCRNYGNKVLSHPLIVEAIETYFVPLAIYNNKEGKDREVLNYFKEPSWNNPVIRIIDHKKNNLINRVSGNYTALGLVDAMVVVMTKQKIKIPEYLNLLQLELAAEQSGIETTYLSMYCFWSGEKKLAEIDGIVKTQAGFMGGREVVKVDFAPDVIAYEDLLKKARTKSCASHVFSNDLHQQLSAEKILGSQYVSEKSSYKKDKETKYYLYKSSFKYLPMTKIQAIKANSLIGKGESPNSVFSSRQLILLKYIQDHPNLKWESAIDMDIMAAWENIENTKP